MTRTSIAVCILCGLGSTTMAQESIELNVEARVDTRCEVDGFDRTSYDFTSGTSDTIEFSLYCNTEMNIELVSAYGGLLHEKRSEQAGTREEYLRPYTATLDLVGADFNAKMTSADLEEGVSYEVPGVIFDDVGRLRIELDSPLDDGYAGEYSDQISITVTPSLAMVNS